MDNYSRLVYLVDVMPDKLGMKSYKVSWPTLSDLVDIIVRMIWLVEFLINVTTLSSFNILLFNFRLVLINTLT